MRSRIAFCRWVARRGRQVFTMGADGSHVRQLTGGAGQGQNWYPSWSPDGRRMCFVSDRDGKSQLYAMNGDGSTQERLTAIQSAHDDWPDWASDGQMIVFSRGERGRLQELYALDLGCGREERVTSDETLDYSPSWSSNGAFVAFRRSFEGPGGVHVMRAEGGEPWLLTAGYCPSWSLAGAEIAHSHLGHLWVMAVDEDGRGAGDARQLTYDREEEHGRPTWSPDGARLAFHSRLREGHKWSWHIVTMRVDDSDVRDLGEGDSPAWSPVALSAEKGGEATDDD